MKAHSSVFNNVHIESVFIHLVLSYSYLPLFTQGQFFQNMVPTCNSGENTVSIRLDLFYS